MKLILTTAVQHLGEAGDVVEVRDGYGRNYLLPQGHAIAYNRGTAKQIEGIRRARNARVIRDNEHALQLREQLEALTVRVPANVSVSGKLFGAVTGSDVAVAVKRAGGPALDKRAIKPWKPIKRLGTHSEGPPEGHCGRVPRGTRPQCCAAGAPRFAAPSNPPRGPVRALLRGARRAVVEAEGRSLPERDDPVDGASAGGVRWRRAWRPNHERQPGARRDRGDLPRHRRDRPGGGEQGSGWGPSWRRA